MSIHLQSFLYKTPIESLRAFFGDVSANAFSEVDWLAPRPSLVDTLTETIGALDDRNRDRVYSDVDRVGQFKGEQSWRVLRGVLASDPQALDLFDALEDVTARALLVLMRKDDLFDEALSAIYVDRFLNGRDWTGFDFEPGGKLEVRTDAPINQFQIRLQKIFGEAGPAPRMQVRRFTRRDLDPAGTGTLIREQLTIFVEAVPEATLAFGKGSGLETHIVRPVQEGALLFDARERTLDVVAKGGGKERRRLIGSAFVETMMMPGVTLAQRSRRTLALDKLKRRPLFDLRPEDRVHHVEVTGLTLRSPDFGAMVTFELRGRGDRRTGGDLYERAEGAFGRRGILTRRGWSVIVAKLRIMFEPEKPKARRKSVTFELKGPDRTNLRDQMELHRRIADTLLDRWGLYAADE